jgi:hypothetical protein
MPNEKACGRPMTLALIARFPARETRDPAVRPLGGAAPSVRGHVLLPDLSAAVRALLGSVVTH